MKKQLIIVGIIAVAIIVIAIATLFFVANPFVTNDENKFIGTWKSIHIEYFITFNSNKTFTTNNGTTGTWETNQGTIILSVIDDKRPYAYGYSFSNNDKTLTFNSISSGVPPNVFTKQ